MTTSRMPEPADAFEDAGLPGTDPVLPQKILTGDEQEGIAPPGEDRLYSDGYGVTAAEQARGETIDAYLAAEEPDVLAALEDPADSYSDADSAADPFTDVDQRVGRLVDIDEGARSDSEPDLIGSDVGTDTGGFSAEEQAMHLVPEPLDVTDLSHGLDDELAPGGGRPAD